MWLPLAHPLLGTWPATQACALTGKRTADPLICRLALNPLSYTSQDSEDTSDLKSEILSAYLNQDSTGKYKTQKGFCIPKGLNPSEEKLGLERKSLLVMI